MFMELSPHKISQLRRAVACIRKYKPKDSLAQKDIIERRFIMRYITEKDIMFFLKTDRRNAKKILSQLIELQKDHPEFESDEGTVNPAIFFMVFGNCYGVK